ncbi:MAG: hypothetical protein WCT16_00480 [Candidatus Buchananbacteria bacterium]
MRRLSYKIIVYAMLLILGLIFTGLAVWFYSGQARDFERLKGLKTWQDIMAGYFSKYNTYQVVDCNSGMIISQCFPNQTTPLDPISQGNYKYLVGALGESDYEINFYLERGIGGLKAGGYIWTKNGVK